MNMMKFLKKYCALVMILLMQINSYAAVGANDGSAFVTKAEFDALVNTFNEQMDTYEYSLESKVDGAIANYLAGLSSETTTNKKVGYLNIIPSTETIVTMQANDSFPYVGGYPKVKFYGTISSIYTYVYASWGSGSITYNGTDSGARRFVTEEGSGASKIYRWNGYTNNYRENFDISWGLDGKSKDMGYTTTNYLYSFGTTDLSETAPTKDFDFKKLKWLIGAVNSTGFSQGTNCTVETTWNSYNVTNKYDLIYSDYETSDQKSNNMRCFIEQNPNKYYFAGSGITYWDLFNASSASGTYSYAAGTEKVTGPQTVTTKSHGVHRGTNYAYWENYKMLSCGYEPNITSWGMVFSKDTTVYEDKAKTEGVQKFQNYNMINGAAFGVVRKGGVYTWPVEFTDTKNDTTVWLKYGLFDGIPVTDDCIEVQVDNGNIYQSATIKNGKGTIKFTAPKDGLLFFKWSRGKSLKIAESINYVEVYDNK